MTLKFKDVLSLLGSMPMDIMEAYGTNGAETYFAFAFVTELLRLHLSSEGIGAAEIIDKLQHYAMQAAYSINYDKDHDIMEPEWKDLDFELLERLTKVD